MKSEGSLLLADRDQHDFTPDGPVIRFITEYLLNPQDVWNRIWDAVVAWITGIVPWVIALLALIVAILVGIRLFALVRDLRLGRGGRRIQILLPPSIPDHGGEVLWTALHGHIRPRWKRLLRGQPYFAWEISSNSDRIEISLWVPEAVSVADAEKAIDSAWPGASVMEVSQEVPLANGSALKTCQMSLAREEWLPLGEGPDADPLRLALSAMTSVGEDEGCTMQVLARPSPSSRGRRMLRRFASARLGKRPWYKAWLRRNAPGPMPSVERNPTADLELRQAHTKAGSQLWECSVRLAVGAPTPGRAKARIHSLASAFSMFEGTNGLRRHRLFFGRHRVSRRILSRRFLLSVKELGILATLPTSAVPGMESAHARIVAPTRTLPSEGRVLGTSNSGISGRTVAISVADGHHHLHVVGETGTGKSTFIANLVLQDAAAGRAAVVIDPKGDLIEAILERLPPGAEHRTCLIDPTDPTVSVGLNVLEGDDPELVVDHIASLFKRIYEHHWGPRSDDILRAACLTLTHIPGATLAEVPLLLTTPNWRKAIRYRLGDPVLRHFWEQFDNKAEAQRAQDIAPLMNKLRAFLMRGAIRTILGQSNPKRNFEELLDQGGLILVRIPKGLLGEDTSRLLGGLVIARIWQACMKRSAQPEADRRDVALYVDEMHNYLTLPRSFEDLLAEARGYRLSLVLAHQHLGQLNRDVRDALDANARTKIAFACAPGDGLTLEKHFVPLLTAYDLSRLPAFTAACRPCLNGGNGDPFTFRTHPLGLGSGERATEVRVASGENFGVKRSEVDRQISHRQMKPDIILLPKSGDGFSRGRSPGSSDGLSGGFPSSPSPEGPEDPGEAA